jgi:hypothetical protein
MEAGGQMSVVRSAAAFVGLLVLILLALVFGAGRISCYAQEFDGIHGHAEHHDVYKDLVNPHTGGNCCHDQDCRPGNVWRDADGTLRARIGSLTVKVPESALLPEKMSPHPPVGMICERAGYIYCVSLSGAGG